MNQTLKHTLKLAIIVLAVVMVAVPAGVLAIGRVSQDKVPEDTVTTYHYDALNEQWIKDVETTPIEPDPDGTFRKGSNTVIIRVKANEPIQEIIVTEATVIGGLDPLFEISGHDPLGLGTGELRIGTLKLEKVDAKRLDFDNTDVVRVEAVNVAADDNEFDVDVEVVNVIFVGRGGPSSLFIGAGRSDLFDILKVEGALDGKNIVAQFQLGARVDRVRILGPDSGDGHIERLIVRNSSVFGTIQVRDAKIQNLILRDISLED